MPGQCPNLDLKESQLEFQFSQVFLEAKMLFRQVASVRYRPVMFEGGDSHLDIPCKVYPKNTALKRLRNCRTIIAILTIGEEAAPDQDVPLGDRWGSQPTRANKGQTRLISA